MRTRLSVLAIAICAPFALVLTLAACGQALASSTWTKPAVLATCGAATSPRVAIPFSRPTVRSGEGAIIWLGTQLPGAGGCPSSPSASQTIDVAGVHSDDLPGLARSFTSGAAESVPLEGPLETTTTSDGHIVVVAGSAASSTLGEPEAMLAGGSVLPGVHALSPLYGPDDLVATANGYIGDADIATVSQTTSGTNEIALFVQRHYETSFGHPEYFAAGSQPITALALGMDFRADTIIVWAEGGELWSRWVTNKDVAAAPQKLGPCGSDPEISAVLSDDDRAFVAWSDTPAAGISGVTRVYLDHSAIGVVFKTPSVLAHFTQPANERLAPGSVVLERLAGEGLALVWPTMVDGRYAVEAANLTSHRLLTPSLLRVSGDDVRLGAVASGPANDIIALVEVAPRLSAGGFDTSHQAIYAVRSGENHMGIGFSALEPVAAAGPNTAPALAVDPANGRAIAAWQTLVDGVAQIAWSLRWQP
jgi:hypothetical protein